MRTRRTLLLALVLARVGLAAEINVQVELRKSIGQRHWYGVYLMGQKCGYAHIQCQAAQVDGREAVAFSLDFHAKIVSLGTKQEVEVQENRVYFQTGELHKVASRFKTGANDTEVSAVVKGDKLLVVSRTVQGETTRELPVPKESLRDALLADALLTRPDAQIGQKVTTTQFEPTLLKELETTHTLKERKTITYHGVATEVLVIASEVPAIGVGTQVYVDGRGVALELTIASMFVLRNEPEAMAKDIQYSGDLIRLGCVKLDPHPPRVERLKKLRLQVWGLDDEAMILNDQGQQWTKQPDGSRIVTTKVPAIDPAQVAKLPVDREKFAEELASTMFIQCNDKRIQAAAAQITGGERDSYAAAKKINDWVFQNLKKVGTGALSNALDTLAAKEGDCTEHTVLFVALARAAGIPAREVAGVTAISRGEGLYYHAWPEVWVGQWVAMDPTLGQHVADATHIKFGQGGGERFYRIISIFGRLKAKVLEHSEE